MVHLVEDTIQATGSISYGENRGEDRVACRPRPLGSFLDASGECLQGGLGGFWRNRHHGGMLRLLHLTFQSQYILKY